MSLAAAAAAAAHWDLVMDLLFKITLESGVHELNVANMKLICIHNRVVIREVFDIASLKVFRNVSYN